MGRRTEPGLAELIAELGGQFQSLVDQNIAGVWMLDESGTVVYVNDGFPAICGMAREQVIGHPMAAFVPDEDRETLRRQLDALLTTGAPVNIEARVVAADGELKYLMVHAARAQRDGRWVAVGLGIDVTDRRRAEVLRQRAELLIDVVTQAERIAACSATERYLIEEMCRIVSDVGAFPFVVGYLADDEGRLQFAGASERCNGCTTSPVGVDIAQLAVSTGRIQLRVADDVSVLGRCHIRAREVAFRSAAFVPFGPARRPIGALGCFIESPTSPDEHQQALVLQVAGQLATAVIAMRHADERRQHEAQLKSGLEQAVVMLAAAVEARDPYTAGHQANVAKLAVAIGRELGFDDDRLMGLRLAALIHDVGKIALPLEILTRPGDLTPLEIALLQTHAQRGYDILKSVSFPWPIATFVRQHHERLDGSGYPDRLTGEAITFDARVLGIADFVEAFSAHRPYHVGRPTENALAVIAAHRGTRFDEQAVDACVRVFEHGFAFDHQVVAQGCPFPDVVLPMPDSEHAVDQPVVASAG